MGWEARERGGLYYYRKEREGSSVRSRYVGAGAFAALASQLDKLDGEEARAERDAERALRETDERIDEEIAAHGQLVETLAVASLLAAGFHTHKREWRRART
jgi:hypothetical protein